MNKVFLLRRSRNSRLPEKLLHAVLSTVDSNASVENTFKLTKHFLYRNKRKQRISRFILRNARFIDSRHKERGFPLKRSRGGVKPPEKTWRKKRTRKINKHFRHPKFADKLDQDDFMKEVMALNEKGVMEYKSVKDFKNALQKNKERKEKESLRLEKRKENQKLQLAKGIKKNEETLKRTRKSTGDLPNKKPKVEESEFAMRKSKVEFMKESLSASPMSPSKHNEENMKGIKGEDVVKVESVKDSKHIVVKNRIKKDT